MNEISYTDWNAMTDDRIIFQVGAFIKHHRIAQNKTQEALARDAGISRSTLSLLERGGIVTVTTLIQVLRVLDLLRVLDGFTISRRPSPLALARAEERKRRRASSPGKGKATIKEEDVDW